MKPKKIKKLFKKQGLDFTTKKNKNTWFCGNVVIQFGKNKKGKNKIILLEKENHFEVV